MKDWLKENIIIPWRLRRDRKNVATAALSPLFIELTNYCNFNCDFCAYGFMKREKRHMDFNLACQILEAVAEEGIVERICPHFVGEPFLYPHIFEFLARAREMDIPVELFTNGSLLDEKGIKKIYELKLRRLLLSFQTPDKSSFVFRHAPLSFDEFLIKTEVIIENKFIYNSPTEIEIQFLSTHKISPRGKVHSLETVEQVQEALGLFEKFSQRLGEKFHLNGSSFHVPDLKDIPPSGKIFKILPGVEIYFRQACLWNNPSDMLGPETAIRKRRRGYCPLPFQMLVILSNGQATACCMDYEGEIKLGDIREKGIKGIWLGEKLSRIREEMKRGFISEEACQRCQGELSGPGVKDVLKR